MKSVRTRTTSPVSYCIMNGKDIYHNRQRFAFTFVALLLFSVPSDCGATRTAKHIADGLQDIVMQKTHVTFVSDAVPIENAVWEQAKECLPSPPKPDALSMPGFDESSQESAREWLRQGPFDNDTMLACRLDGANDQVGRLMDAMIFRLQLHQVRRVKKGAVAAQNHFKDSSGRAPKILFDARSLQMEGYASRGIGLYAKDALDSLRSVANHDDIVLLIDPVEADLPDEVGRKHHRVSSVDESSAGSYGALIQPSPMTSSPEPLFALLRKNEAVKVAIVYDFIPVHHASAYLPGVVQRAEYAVALDALLLYYDQYISISRATQHELKKLVAAKLRQFSRDNHGLAFLRSLRNNARFRVALPSRITDMRMKEILSRNARDGSIVIMTGMDPRKNTIAALAAAQLSRVPRAPTIRVLGMAGVDDLVQTWCASLGIPFDRVQVLDRVSDHKKKKILGMASLVIVPSFDEGLSLPIIEALTEGTPVVASAIPSHKELIGTFGYLASPKNVSELAQAIDVHYEDLGTAQAQRKHYLSQNYVPLRKAIIASLSEGSFRSSRREMSKETRKYFSPASSLPTTKYSKVVAVSSPKKPPRRLSIGIATPWPPQQSGIADFSSSVIPDLALRADVTVYVTSSPQVTTGSTFKVKPASYLLKIARNAHQHDVLISVLGNSEFHLPFLRLLSRHDCHVIAHDTRVVNVYLALRGGDGLLALMSKAVDAPEQRNDTTVLDQVMNFDLLQNLGYGEIVRTAKSLYMHTSLIRERVAKETGTMPKILPFPIYLHGIPADLSAEARQAMRAALGFSDDCFHVSTFGWVDLMYKQVDKLIMAAAIVSRAVRPVCLHLVGTVPPHLLSFAENEKERYRAEGSLLRLDFVGRVTEEQYVQHMFATQLGVQLRSNPLLGISGSLSDLAAIGTPAIGSRGLCQEIDAPKYIEVVPDNVSAEELADKIKERLGRRENWHDLGKEREKYVEHMSVERYNKLLLEDLSSSINQRIVKK